MKFNEAKLKKYTLIHDKQEKIILAVKEINKFIRTKDNNNYTIIEIVGVEPFNKDDSVIKIANFLDIWEMQNINIEGIQVDDLLEITYTVNRGKYKNFLKVVHLGQNLGCN